MSLTFFVEAMNIGLEFEIVFLMLRKQIPTVYKGVLVAVGRSDLPVRGQGIAFEGISQDRLHTRQLQFIFGRLRVFK